MLSVATPVRGATWSTWGSWPVSDRKNADRDEQQHRADEDIGRAGEQGPALPQPAQVHDHDQQDRQRDELNGPRLKRRKAE